MKEFDRVLLLLTMSLAATSDRPCCSEGYGNQTPVPGRESAPGM